MVITLNAVHVRRSFHCHHGCQGLELREPDQSAGMVAAERILAGGPAEDMAAATG